MARPKRNNADYFPHDSGLRNDPRVKALRTKYGLNGYAVFVMLLESITDADGLSLHWTDIAVEIMAGDFACESDYLREILSYCVRINLLQLDDAHVQSFELSRDLEPVFEKRKRAYAAFLSQNDTETTRGQRQSAAENTQSKEEKRREKEIREKEKADKSAAFDLFWDSYSKKTGKEKSFAKWMKLPLEIMPVILESAKRYADTFTDDRKYQKDPLTWLNGKHWNDVITVPGTLPYNQSEWLAAGPQRRDFYDASSYEHALSKFKQGLPW